MTRPAAVAVTCAALGILGITSLFWGLAGLLGAWERRAEDQPRLSRTGRCGRRTKRPRLQPGALLRVPGSGERITWRPPGVHGLVGAGS